MAIFKGFECLIYRKSFQRKPTSSSCTGQLSTPAPSNSPLKRIPCQLNRLPALLAHFLLYFSSMKPHNVLFAIGSMVLTAAAIPAQAQDAAPPLESLDSSTNLINLNYYPHPGKFLFSPRYQMPILSHQYSSANGVNTSSTESTFEQADLTLAYGLPLDGLRIAVSESELFHRHNDIVNARTGALTTTQSTGLSDPTLSLTYRALNQNPWALDVGLSTSPSLVNHRITNAAEEGNNGKGYGTITPNLALYWAHSCIETELAASLARDLAGSSVQDIGDISNVTSTRNAAWSASFDLTARAHLGARWFIQPEGVFNVPRSYSQVNISTPDITHTLNEPFYVVPRLSVGYLPASGILLDTAVGYSHYTEKVTQPPSPDSANEFKTVTWWLRARFEI